MQNLTTGDPAFYKGRQWGLRIGATIELNHLVSQLRETAMTTSSNGSAQTASKKTDPLVAGSTSFLALTFGVVLPVVALLIEAIFHLCGGVFFDPLPTPAHYVFVGAVPVINCIIYFALWQKQIMRPVALSIAGGLAMGISLVYALAFAPLMPMAFPAVLMAGLGMLPLAPLFACLSAYGLLVALRMKTQNVKTLAPLKYTLIGMTCGVALMMSAELPGVFTRIAMTQAVSADPAISRGGIRMLRTFGSEGWLLAECYDHLPTMSDILMGALHAYDWNTKSKARRIYYRVFGESFNSVPRPQKFGFGWNFNRADTWDDELGGDEVGGKAANLSLAESSLSGVVEPQGAIGYLEWTFNFKNDSSDTQEARTQIALPPGAVVSRLTLWINGKPQEAVFGSREVTKSAYKSVVHKRRDPVLVTMLGPDRVLLQCFPVPPNGGTMRTRIGITVPLTLDDKSHARLVLPRLLENNFVVAGKHNLFIQSPTACTATLDGLKIDKSAGKNYQVHGFVDARHYQQGGSAIVAERTPEVVLAQSTYALKDQPAFTYEETLSGVHKTRPQHVIFVVDGGRSMTGYMNEIAQALKELPRGMSAEVRVASDEISALTQNSVEGGEPNMNFAARELPLVPCRGGPDNFKELLTAFTADKKGVAVVWIHGPQPVFADEPWKLASDLNAILLRRRNKDLTVYDVEAESGANCMIELMWGRLKVESVPRRGSLKTDLLALVSKWTGDTPEWQFVRTRKAGSAVQIDALTKAVCETPSQSWLDHVDVQAPADLKQGKAITTPYLAKLWAADETQRLIEAHQSGDAANLAIRFRVVTPVSGAVVLETREQYKAAGLDPDNPDNNAMVPTAPEPEEWLLIFLSAGAILWTVRRQRAMKAATR